MKKKRIITQVIVILIVCGVFTLSIGYSAMGANLSIEEMIASVSSNYVGITSFVPNSQTIEEDTINSYRYKKDEVATNLSLTKENSKVTFEVETTIYTSASYGIGIYEITGLPENLEYQLTDYDLKTRICNNEGECRIAVKKKFYITIQYKENGYIAENTNYDLHLKFDFREIHAITYQNVEYFAILPREIIDKDTTPLVIELEEGTYEVSGKVDSSIKNNTISLLLAEGDVVITKNS